MLHFINPIGLDVGNRALIAVAPPHFQPDWLSSIGVLREDAHGLVSRQITPATDHLLALRYRTAHEPEPGPDPSCVRRQPLQTDRDSARRGVIAIQTGHCIEIVHHYVQIPVVVQVSQRHPIGNSGLIEAPLTTHWFKGSIAPIAKRGFLRPRVGPELV